MEKHWMAYLVGSVFLGMACGGCTSSKNKKSAEGSFLPAPTVWFEPTDLTSSVADSPLRLGIDNYGITVDPGLLDALAKQTSLRTWPELKPIDVTVMQQPPDANGDKRAYVILEPKEPLADRWYVMHVAALPEGLKWPAYPALRKLSDGAAVSRFRPGSDPVFESVLVCKKDDAQALISVFSEKVKAQHPFEQVIHLVVDGKSDICSSVDDFENGSSSPYFRCIGASDEASVRFSFASELTSLEGEPLRVLDDRTGTVADYIPGASYTFTISDLPEWGTGCRVFWPKQSDDAPAR